MRFRAAFLLACAVGCGRPETPPAAPSSTAEVDRTGAHEAEAEVAPLPSSNLPAPPRLVAIGDLHGDLAAFRAALRLAGAIDDADRWIGGALWIVQTGDVLDRGDDEPEILALVERLEAESSRAGGRFVALNGNHELMNAQGDFRYVTPEGFSDFEAFADRVPANLRARIPSEVRGRVGAFAPGGPIARELATHATAIRIGDSVFVHGGLSPEIAELGLDTINRDVRAFLLGEAELPAPVSGQDGPVWNRDFGGHDDPATCASLARSLATLHARRMVVGHTVQPQGIGSACDGKVWRIDVGLARHYGGPIEVLEIAGDTPRVLRGTRG